MYNSDIKFSDLMIVSTNGKMMELDITEVMQKYYLSFTGCYEI